MEVSSFVFIGGEAKHAKNGLAIAEPDSLVSYQMASILPLIVFLLATCQDLADALRLEVHFALAGALKSRTFWFFAICKCLVHSRQLNAHFSFEDVRVQCSPELQP